ncbi:MAG: hypothetical protein H7196_03000 [candidate division SR1 bacterium]|nr:hypothetical protein [candidate division SR1 bacterium]
MSNHRKSVDFADLIGDGSVNYFESPYPPESASIIQGEHCIIPKPFVYPQVLEISEPKERKICITSFSNLKKAELPIACIHPIYGE